MDAIRHDDAKIVHCLATVVAGMDHVAMLLLGNTFVEGVANFFLAQEPRVGNKRETLLIAPRGRDRRRVAYHDCGDRRAARNRPRTTTPISTPECASNRRNI